MNTAALKACHDARTRLEQYKWWKVREVHQVSHNGKVYGIVKVRENTGKITYEALGMKFSTPQAVADAIEEEHEKKEYVEKWKRKIEETAIENAGSFLSRRWHCKMERR